MKLPGFTSNATRNQAFCLFLYSNLGIDNMYFLMENVETISNHIMALYAAKMIAFTKNDTSFDVNLEQETDSAAVYIHNSCPGVSVTDGPNYERRIDELYLNKSNPEKSYRLV